MLDIIQKCICVYLLSLFTNENVEKVVITYLVGVFVPDRRPDVGPVEYGREVERKLQVGNVW